MTLKDMSLQPGVKSSSGILLNAIHYVARNSGPGPAMYQALGILYLALDLALDQV